ncbi:MAG: hypothetical protein Q4A17_08770 [Thermoguttaceae bacterium]|nr:hypothetical protein [Thermoguttaceae bacterium]MDO4858021.1 hypothetical protein [Thermoguttaceae bacterium]
MSELIVVRCHACNVGMKIKPEYAGKLRKCPKCGEIFIVPQEDGQTIVPPPEVLEQIRRQEAAQNSAEPKPQEQPQESAPSPFSAPSAEIVVPEEETIKPVEHPKRLNPQFRYVILNSERMIAYWQMSTGWQISDGSRLVPAKRNAQLLPKQGDFRFIEMQLGDVDGEFRITKLRIFQLASQYSVSKIAGDEGEVLTTITKAAGLTRSQKGALLQGLKAHFMRSVWADSPAIYDFLFNEDFHSSEI